MESWVIGCVSTGSESSVLRTWPGRVSFARQAAVTSATPNYSTFFVGDSKTAVFTNPNRGNSANGVIDEVRVYASALTAAQITADMNAAHVCTVVGPNHYELSLPTSSISCLPATATVTACADGRGN